MTNIAIEITANIKICKKILSIKLLKNISTTAPTLNHINVKLGVNISAIPNKTATINHINFILSTLFSYEL
ncbi:hypothetical protein BN165_640002 [Clostridioides difficile E1]|nr:hypothetical protein BN165_640002 [Clostridioides difficile E1]